MHLLLLFFFVWLPVSTINVPVEKSTSIQIPSWARQWKAPAIVSSETFSPTTGSIDHDLSMVTRSYRLSLQLRVLMNTRAWQSQWTPALINVYNSVLHGCRWVFNLALRCWQTALDGTDRMYWIVYDWYSCPWLEYSLWTSPSVPDHLDWSLVRDESGCFNDIWNTSLCLTPGNTTQLQDHLDDQFEAMSFEDQAYTLRYKQPFVVWATHSSTFTRQLVRQLHQQWFHSMHTIYLALDQALAASATALQDVAANPATTCPSSRWFDPVCPHDPTRLEVFFALSPFAGDAAVIPTPMPLFPLGRLDHLSKMSAKKLPRSLRTHLRSYPAYGSHCTDAMLPVILQHHQRLIRTLQAAMIASFDRFQKKTLQHHLSLQQQERDLPPAALTMYKELQLYMHVTTRQHFYNHMDQLLNATLQYDTLSMSLVNHTHRQWLWAQKEEQLRPRLPPKWTSPPPLTPDDRWQQWWQDHRRTSTSVWQILCDWLRYFWTWFTQEEKPQTANPLTDDSPPSTATSPSATACARGVLTECALHWIRQDADSDLQPYRQQLIQQYTSIFRSLDHDLHLVWLAAVDQVQGRHRILPHCGTLCSYDYHIILLACLLIFLLFF
ncbi:hypothetical protein DM01DRAFT_363609 [Hesseltinella vesiculosa]|uniref:Uncharacterized protein n=1 Tax=Hesseltinella vesiculosa TaxID=101127 RepID=A0A1X2GL34_9FUNG|nr:hypothetical protein DM01DRAFT_363609 [Hesseltinella vesiculosa]